MHGRGGCCLRKQGWDGLGEGVRVALQGLRKEGVDEGGRAGLCSARDATCGAVPHVLSKVGWACSAVQMRR